MEQARNVVGTRVRELRLAKRVTQQRLAVLCSLAGYEVTRSSLACYECRLGRIDVAKSLLNKAFEIEPKWRAAALDDEDLNAVWESI